MQHNTITLLAGFGLLLLTGCGGGGPGDTPEIGQVTGKVTLDDKPVANATVTFQPEGGRPASGTTDSDGNYTLKYSTTETGAKVGKNVVTISSARPESADEDCSKQGDEEAVFFDPIPPKYNTESAKNAEMTVDVKEGDNEFNFPLKSDPNHKPGKKPKRAPRRDPCSCEPVKEE